MTKKLVFGKVNIYRYYLIPGLVVLHDRNEFTIFNTLRIND